MSLTLFKVMYFHGSMDGVVAREESMILLITLSQKLPGFFFFFFFKFTFLLNLLFAFLFILFMVIG